jgi:hypothetical protein
MASRTAELRQLEIGLLTQEAVQIILSGGRIKRPGRPTKLRYPVVRRPAVGPRIAPDIPVTLAAEAGGAALLKPGVSVRRVVGYEVENDFQMALMRRFYQPIDVGERSKDRLDAQIIRYVVAEVGHRRWMEWRDPDRVDAKPAQIVEALNDAIQITDPIPVRILK